MKRFAGARWRIPGAIVAWVLFMFSFTTMVLAAGAVAGLGGFCANGGPYVIETQCPGAVVAFVPLSIFGGLAAVALGAIFAQGFGTPLLAWAWPVLFVGLGIASLISSTMPGGITFLLIGVLFVVMGAVPLVLEFRVSPQRLFLGSTNAADTRFAENARAGWSPTQFTQYGSRESGQPIPATAGDWVLSLGILVASVALGIYLAQLLWAAAGG